MLALIACSSDLPVAPPTAWDWSSPGESPPTLSEAELDQALAEVVAALLETDPRLPTYAFIDALEHVDGACPEREGNLSQMVVEGDCTTGDGWSWYGLGMAVEIRDFPVAIGDEDTWHRFYDFTTGNARLTGPSGEEFGLMGESLYRDWDDDQARRVLTAELWGEFSMAGSPWADTWMGKDRGVELHVEMIEGEGGTWSGGMSRLDGEAWAFVIDLTVGGACAAEPTGTLDLRDAGGSWYEVTFDGNVACDGCGAVTTNGAPVGQACGDFTPLAAWEVDPWSG